MKEQVVQCRDLGFSIHSSSLLSGTCDAAREAVAALGAEDRIQVFDSQYICGGLGLIALAAARRAGADD